MKLTASILGASGYVGGELVRLLLQHPHISIGQATSTRLAGKFLHAAHPNLRGLTRQTFVPHEAIGPCDVLLVALPHGQAASQIDALAQLAPRIIDLSADFRLRSAAAYERWYGGPHPASQWLARFVYGLPELHRDELREASFVSGVGCNATAVNLALWPLAKAGVIESVVVEVKVGSSEGGVEHSAATHHPERSGGFRTFAPTGHRHVAEIQQELGDFPIHFTATAVEMVRGIHATSHVFLSRDVSEKEVWQIYRQAYQDHSFIRIVKERQGIHRMPEPKLLAGTNWCDIGFERDPDSWRLVVISALDNLMKGAAGSAVQALNLMCGWPERTGLEFPGLHPV
jgi:N-acetyl-gamma-glutamyl-phosphate/LysW-gamma-L-alpha-aminoadipyl-6-phosphate reductase